MPKYHITEFDLEMRKLREKRWETQLMKKEREEQEAQARRLRKEKEDSNETA